MLKQAYNVHLVWYIQFRNASIESIYLFLIFEKMKLKLLAEWDEETT